jgi:glycine dehydrogenase subunit 2
MNLIVEKGSPGRRGLRIPSSDVPTSVHIDKRFLRQEPARLGELSELDVVRHFTGLARKNFRVLPIGILHREVQSEVYRKDRCL